MTDEERIRHLRVALEIIAELPSTLKEPHDVDCFHIAVDIARTALKLVGEKS